MSDELYSEFLLRICEIGEDKFIEIKNSPEGDYTDWFCMDVISKIWSKRNRVKSYDVGSTNALFEYTSTYSDNELKFQTDEDFNFDYHYKEVKDILDQDINSDDIEVQYQARVYTYSVGLDIIGGKAKEGGKYCNILQFSKAVKIPYTSARHAYVRYIKRLKNKLL